MHKRAWSTFEIKGVDESTRTIEGVATTPHVDLMDDIVEPMGAEFDLPLPVLRQHDSHSPVGHVIKAKPAKDGIPVTIQLQRTDEPGEVKDRLDAAWEDVRLGLTRGLSIGFAPIESTDIEGSRWGRRFTKWKWLELSLVTIPANQEANITSIKSIDTELRAALGREEPGEQRTPPPGASGTRPIVKLIKPKLREGQVNITERIAAFEATRAAKAARMEEITEKVGSEGRTKDESEQEEFDTLRDEIKSIDRELGDLREMQKINMQKAQPVEGATTIPKAGEVRSPTRVRVTQKVEPGIRFARMAKCVGMAKGNMHQALSIAESRYADDNGIQTVLREAVAAGGTASGNWASALVGEETSMFADFVEFLRPMTILGKFGTGGIPSLRRVPFRTPLVSQTGGGEGYWVGEGKPKPLTAFDFSRTTLEPLKVANIAVLTMEVLRDSSPSAEFIVRDELANALRARLDTDFVDTTKTASSGVSPASITNGATEIVASGTGDADDVRLDVRSLFQQFINNNNTPTSGVWIMSSSLALSLSVLLNPLGQQEFPAINMSGGTFFGLPVITSEYMPAGIVALVNASDVYLADDGEVSIDVSREASLQMDDAPGTQDALTGTGTSLVSLWQTNSVGFLAERTINWKLRRASAVQLLTGVAWGGAVTEEES